MSQYRLTAAIISAACIVGGLYFYEPPKPPPPENVSKVETENEPEPEPVRGVGLIDFEQIKAIHPDGALLNELIERRIALKAELDEVMIPVIPPTPPQIDEKPFDDSAREKTMQELMAQLSDLKAKEISLTEKYRAETEETYLANRNAVREIFFNEAMNISLKLQNADNLRLSKEEVEKLQTRLDEITAERNRRQAQMREAWINEITAKVNAEITAEAEKIKSEYDKVYRESVEESARRARQVEERNKALMAVAQEIEYRQNRRKELVEELAETSKQIDELENKIFDSISGEAGKLAAMLKLQLVFSIDDSVFNNDLTFQPPQSYGKNFRPNSKTVVYSAGGITDLTKDLIQSMKLKGLLDR